MYLRLDSFDEFRISRQDKSPRKLSVFSFEIFRFISQIVCRYSADTKENANKLHYQCTDFHSSMRVTVYAECSLCVFIKILSSSLNAMLIVDTHCSDVCCHGFPVPQRQCHEKFYLQSVWDNWLCKTPEISKFVDE